MRTARTGSPTVLRMVLARQLQALREKAGLGYEQAAEAIYASPWTVRRMERADGGLKPLAVKGLLVAYGVTGPREIGTLLGLAKEASKPGWWHSYGDVGFPGASAAEAGRLVRLRMQRQLVLTRPGPPHLWMVLDEAVLHRRAGGPQVTRAQLDRLIDAIATPGVTLQILPFSAGPHRVMYGPFRVYRFPGDELPDIVYGENMTSAYYLDRPEEAERDGGPARPAGRDRHTPRRATAVSANVRDLPEPSRPHRQGR